MLDFEATSGDFRQIFNKDAGFCEFCRQLESGQASHAYIIDCADKILYSDLLSCCASEIIGGGEKEKTLVFARSHPDVESFPSEDKKRTSVDDIKKITASAYLKPTRAGKKVFCISAGGVGMESWQNKLLKLLEEPPANVYFLIVVPSAEELLPTIRSRCQIIKMGRFGVETIAEFLNAKRNIPKDKANQYARLAEGSIEKAIEISASADYANCVKDVLYLLGNLTGTKNMSEFLNLVAKYKDNHETFLEIIEKVYFEALVIATNASQSLNLFEKNAIMKIVGLYTVDALMRSVLLVEQAKKQLDNNANYTMVMDGLLLKILEVRYLCRQ